MATFKRFGKKPPKYRNRRVRVGLLTFDSKKEARRYGELVLLEQAGVIRGLRLQWRFRIEVNGVHVCDYTADFTYEEGGRLVVEDVKGWATDEYKLKRKLVRAVLGVEIRET